MRRRERPQNRLRANDGPPHSVDDKITGYTVDQALHRNAMSC